MNFTVKTSCLKGIIVEIASGTRRKYFQMVNQQKILTAHFAKAFVLFIFITQKSIYKLFHKNSTDLTTILTSASLIGTIENKILQTTFGMRT